MLQPPNTRDIMSNDVEKLTIGVSDCSKSPFAVIRVFFINVMTFQLQIIRTVSIDVKYSKMK